MQRGRLDDLQAFVAVARERSFTKAAAKLGVSQSALSHTLRELEERLGVRLLSRTTRSVSPTEAGARLLHSIGPRFDEIEAEVASVRELREKPAGTIRITATENATETILVPKLAPLLREYPDIKVEIVIDYGLTDIVAQQYDAGVRSGEQVAERHDCRTDRARHADGGRWRALLLPQDAGAEDAAGPRSSTTASTCAWLRMAGMYAWEFEKGGRELRVRVEGQFTFNATGQILNAALAGSGLAYVPETMVQRYLAKGRLKRVLEDWCLPYSGYHLFYPSRRQSSAAFALVIDALRYRPLAEAERRR